MLSDLSPLIRMINAVSEMSPHGQRQSKETIALCIQGLPPACVENLNDNVLKFCWQQFCLKPEYGADNLPPIQRLLQHAFRMRDGSPHYTWGLKQDLSIRMAEPNRFYGHTTSQWELDAMNPELEGKRPARLEAQDPFASKPDLLEGLF